MKICEICISSLFYSLKNILGMMFFSQLIWYLVPGKLVMQ